MDKDLKGLRHGKEKLYGGLVMVFGGLISSCSTALISSAMPF